MGKPITAVAAATSTSTPAQSPTQSPVQSPTQTAPSKPPVQAEPRKFWPPAYGWRLSALEGQRSAHNTWQSRWLEHGSAVAGGGAIDSVAALKPRLRPHLQRGAHKA